MRVQPRQERSVPQYRRQSSPDIATLFFQVAATSGEWRSGRKNPCQAMRPGTRMNANTVLWYQATSPMPTIRRWRLSVFSIVHRRDAVNGCQCLHRHPLTAYRHKHGRPLRLSPLSSSYKKRRIYPRIGVFSVLCYKKSYCGIL